MKTNVVHEVRRGLIIARIRRTNSRNGLRHTVSLHRLYRNGDHWKESARSVVTTFPSSATHSTWLIRGF